MIRHRSMQSFKDAHGFYPIAGGSSDTVPPDALVVPEETPEPPADTTPPPAASDGFEQGQMEARFTPEDLAKVRKEEKDKLYPRIESLEAELKAARAAEEERLRMAEEEQARKAAEQEKAAEESMEVRELLAKKDAEWQAQIQSITQELEQRDAMLEKERAYASLLSYKQQRLAEVEDSIMPELRDLIDGSSPEEIDASINTMQERTSRILEQVRQYDQQQRQAMPGVKPTGQPPMGPLEENDSAQKMVTPADIRSMTMNEYAKNRERLMQAVSNKVRQQGLYG